MKKPVIVLLSSKPWNTDLPELLFELHGFESRMMKELNEDTVSEIHQIAPDYIFVIHWSDLIPPVIYQDYETIVFHMTDLPYGRGGSPLQNLIQLGFEKTVVSALRCTDVIDGGDIYAKEALSLDGTAEEIFLKANRVMAEMIHYIIVNKPVPKPQQGKPVLFKRRHPADSCLSRCKTGDLNAWHTHIRMLDATGYPHAFIEFNGMLLEFRRASLRSDGLHADVLISKLTKSEGEIK